MSETSQGYRTNTSDEHDILQLLRGFAILLVVFLLVGAGSCRPAAGTELQNSAQSAPRRLRRPSPGSAKN